MSTPGSSISKEPRASQGKQKKSASHHRIRWFLFFVALATALILWKLNAVINLLGITQKNLESWQGIRTDIGDFLIYAADQIAHGASALWHHFSL